MAESVTRLQSTRPLSVAEYLEFERTSPVKHEYVHGELYAFAGASEHHNIISGNVFGLIWIVARRGSCRVFANDMKLQVTEHLFYYPDVMVVCAESDNDPLTKRAPCLIVEVLSPSTARIDRCEKRLAYQDIESLRAYIIIDTDSRRLTHLWRDDSNDWQQVEVIGDGEVTLPCPETTLTLADIYAGIA